MGIGLSGKLSSKLSGRLSGRLSGGLRSGLSGGMSSKAHNYLPFATLPLLHNVISKLLLV